MGWASKAKHHLVSINAQKAFWVNTASELGLEQWMTAGTFVGVAGPAQRTGGGGEPGFHWAGELEEGRFAGMSRGEHTDHCFKTSRSASFLEERRVWICVCFK